MEQKSHQVELIEQIEVGPARPESRARSDDTEIVDYEPEYQEEGAAEADGEQAMDEADGSESELEIITDRPAMSLDNRGLKGSSASVQPLQSQTTSSSMTTEYTPQRRHPSNVLPTEVDSADIPPASVLTEKVIVQNTQFADVAASPPAEAKVDTSTLPPVTAPGTHPSIDPTIPGVHEGRTIFEHDMDALADKPWRKPGSNMSDWFNYGFDEISWEAYCYRKRQLGEDADILKANVINFSGLADNEVISLPPEARAMVMTGTTTLMHNQQANGMMGMNPMMADMNAMQMQMPMGMASIQGMTNDMSGQYSTGMGGLPMQSNDMVESGHAMGLSQDNQNYARNAYNPASSEYLNQGDGEGRGSIEDSPLVSNQGQSSNNTGRGSSYGSGYRGRGAPQPPQAPSRSRTTYRGRGMPPPQGPARSTSPLPPNVPTGPRSQTRYKDRDGPSGASDGLDYGGHKESHYSYHDDDRSSRSRKRRASPRSDDYTRSSKRR